MKTIFRTDRGKVRSHNEDNGGIFSLDEDYLLAVVADGMGGHQAGDVASEMTVAELKKHWKKNDITDINTPEKVEAWLNDVITTINSTLYSYAQEHQECQGMGTTIVTAVFSKDFVTVGNIGDSRCYILNGNGFSQITDDHSLVYELVRSGQITPEDAEHHPRKNVLMRALGTEEAVTVDIKTLEWERDDFLLLCSDGLTNKVSREEMQSLLKEENDIEAKADVLIAKANEAGGEDNITVALIKNEPTESGSE